MDNFKNINKNTFYFILLAITFISFISFNIVSLNDPILRQFGVRQTFNALISYYFVQDGFSFAYEMPNWGEPWSVPHEFPIYQWIVAQFSTIFDMPLTFTGRLVSLIYGLLVAIPIFNILKILKINQEAIYICFILIFSAPVFIYWSGTFMIETSALFYSICFIYYVIKIILGNRDSLSLILLSFFLTLALLQKITTAFPALVVVSIIFLIYLLKDKRFIKEYKFTIKLAISFIIPSIIFLAWFLFSEEVKKLNPLEGSRLSFENSIDWYFGPLKLRISDSLWLSNIFERNIIPSSGIFIGFISFLFFFIKNKNTKLKNIVLVSLAFFLVPFLIHTKVHNVHKYYQVANFIYWSIISGVSIHFFFREYLKVNTKKILLLIFILFVSNYAFYLHKYFFHIKSQILEHNKRTLVLGEYIQKNTEPDAPIVIFGYGGSSVLTFYSERKAISVENDNEAINVLNNLDKYLTKAPSVFVLCPMMSSKGKVLPEEHNIEATKKLIRTNFSEYNNSQLILDCEVISK
jgi:hypothetical protein